MANRAFCHKRWVPSLARTPSVTISEANCCSKGLGPAGQQEGRLRGGPMLTTPSPGTGTPSKQDTKQPLGTLYKHPEPHPPGPQGSSCPPGARALVPSMPARPGTHRNRPTRASTRPPGDSPTCPELLQTRSHVLLQSLHPQGVKEPPYQPALLQAYPSLRDCFSRGAAVSVRLLGPPGAHRT